ncbi:MAG: MFS transporter [Bacteroidetes bacterium]|nr:MAG: MFS transporter [Bacteroidota bacterium]
MGISNRKPKLSFWQIWNMSFGFLGIQFGFALQGGFMSRIFQTLGAAPHDIPGLWLAAPLAGLIVQPIIGYLSDRTWSERYGRRKPFFLIGAIFASIALVFMPHSPLLWIAAGSLLILDASINISMEPFRALVADKLDESQRSYGFMVQTLIIGIGTWVASQLPLLLTKLGVSNEAPDTMIPDNVKIAFAIGGGVFLLSVLYTIFTTKEYPPEDIDEFENEKKQTAGFGNAVAEIFTNIAQMPKTMVKLGVVQFFSWFAFFTMWSMATPALTEHVYESPKPNVELYKIESKIIKDLDSTILDSGVKYDSLFFAYTSNSLPKIKDELSSVEFETISSLIPEDLTSLMKRSHAEGIGLITSSLNIAYQRNDKKFNNAADLVGAAMGTYGLSSMVFALLFVLVTSKIRINRKLVHMASLIAGGLGFILMFHAKDQMMLHVCFALVGISWASILSLPYAMLSSSINPNKMGIFMGLFNMFIVIPQILAALGGINFLSQTMFGEETINTMLLAGTSLIIAGICNLLITNKKAIKYQNNNND